MTSRSWARRLFARTPRTIRTARARFRPGLEALEDRLAPAILTVTTLSDAATHTGTSLRDALAAAAAGDTIKFQAGLSGAINVNPFNLGQGTLTLSQDVTIDGTGASITVEGGMNNLDLNNAQPFVVNSGVTAALNNLTIANGSPGIHAPGGGIANSGTLTISNCTLTGNIARYGGGGIENTGTLTVSNCTLTGNKSDSDSGGGILNNSGGTLTVSNSTLAGNSAFNGGGGIDNEGGTLKVSTTTLSDNSAELVGGGLFCRNGTATVSNSTLVGNSAADGGGIANDANSMTVTNCTLANNLGGGGISSFNPLTLNNTILANNAGGDIAFAAFKTSGSHNLIGDGVGGSSLTNTITGDPKLGPLANNGGPTQTMALLTGSPAIDKGDNTLVDPDLHEDQRGFGRFVGGTVDIGAVEVQTTDTTVTLTSSPAAPVYGQAVTLTAAVSLTLSGAPATAGIVTFLDGGTLMQIGLVSSSGQVTFSTAALTAGTHALLAVYSGGVSFSPVASFLPAAGALSEVVSPASLTVTADAANMYYGDAVPALTYKYAGLVNGDTSASFTGGLTTTATSGSNVGGYDITQGTLAATGNYTIGAFNKGLLSITPATLHVAADAQTKAYGSADPALTYTVTAADLKNGDTSSIVSGSLTRAPGETVAGGPYAISQGTLAANSNYTLAFTGNSLTITPATLHIAADARTKVYGSADPALTYTVTAADLKNGDTSSVVSGSLTRAAGETVAGGPYAITQGTLAVSSNYTLTFTGNSLTITPATLHIAADARTKVYGSADPALTYTLTAADLKNGDTASVVSGSLTRAAGETVAGGPYAITQGTLTAGSNYSIAFTGNSLTITPATLSASGVNLSATAGAAFSGTVATFTTSETVDSAAAFTAVITWEDGTTSSGVISGSSGSFTVSGSHTFATAGTFTSVSVKITNPNTLPATATDIATIAGLGKSVVPGLTGGIGFWSNSNGQALIKHFNGGSNSTALSAWLGANFPNLYGAGAGGNSLLNYQGTGKAATNAQVAAYFTMLFNLGGPKAQAQVLAVALNVYATTSSLGGSTAAAYGFTVSAAGLEAYSYNTGKDGAAFGVANNTTLNVYQLLAAVNKQAKNGVLYGGSVSLQSQCADLLTALNIAGSIS
jgi:hypothetical protein